MLPVRLKPPGRLLLIMLVLLIAGFSMTHLRTLSEVRQKKPLAPNSNILSFGLNATLLESASPYVSAILNIEDKALPRLQCASPVSDRYNYLQQSSTNKANLLKYLFALNLHQAKSVLPGLMGAIVEAIKFLGYSNCALSVVEGRSTDGTLEILTGLQDALKDTGLNYTLQTSNIDPLAAGNDRIRSLAVLRNLALQPFVLQSNRFAADATIIFLNDVILCADDILEIIHQRYHQAADITCAMDWVYLSENPTFYDVWIARGMTGDTFFSIPEDGNWNGAKNLFWNDNEARDWLHAGLPFQVFSCWNGIAAFTAEPLLKKEIAFRSAIEKECFQGEPQLFCKDMWIHGYGKVAVVPSVSVAYTVEGAEKIKASKGYVTKWASDENDAKRIEWRTDPPALVKCMPEYHRQTFLPWNESIETWA